MILTESFDAQKPRNIACGHSSGVTDTNVCKENLTSLSDAKRLYTQIGALKQARVPKLPIAEIEKTQREERHKHGERRIWISPELIPPPLLWLGIAISGLLGMFALLDLGWDALDGSRRLLGVSVLIVGWLLGISTLFGLSCWPLIQGWAETVAEWWRM
jgi:hypothetical protein